MQAFVHAPLFSTAQLNYRKNTARYRWRCCTAEKSKQERTPILRLVNVDYAVPMDAENVVFNKMNLSLYPGEMVIMTGHNGCGKSTALKIMNGLLKPDRGKIEWKGEEVKKPRQLTCNIGIIMQSPGDYFITPTILDELVLARSTRTPDDVRQVMYDVGLQDVSLLTDPKRLSGGQKRRLALASQLLRDPEPQLFTLDEPLVGVDWEGRKDIIQLLAELRHRFAMVIVSHEPSELLPYAHRVVQIARGAAHEVPRCVIDKAIAMGEAERRRTPDPHETIKRLMQ